MTKVLRSDCCEQPVALQYSYTGYGDIPDDKFTTYYTCIKCQEKCNAIEIEVEDKYE
jgi:hypothetical protein